MRQDSRWRLFSDYCILAVAAFGGLARVRAEHPPTSTTDSDSICPVPLSNPFELILQSSVYPVCSVSDAPPTHHVVDEFLSFEDWKMIKASEDAASLSKSNSNVYDHDAHGFNNNYSRDNGDADRDVSNGTAQSLDFDATNMIAPTTYHSDDFNGDPLSGSHSNSNAGSSTGGPPPLRVPLIDRFNYASSDCSARIHSAHKSLKSPVGILNSKRDKYMLSPCSTRDKFVIVELCDDIQIDTIQLANYEFFSGVFKDIAISAAQTYSPNQWNFLGQFSAKNVRTVQSFMLPRDPRFFRYVKIDFRTNYGSEYYCPVSLLRVYGLTQIEDYKWEEWQAAYRREREEATRPLALPDSIRESIIEPNLIAARVEAIMKEAHGRGEDEQAVEIVLEETPSAVSIHDETFESYSTQHAHPTAVAIHDDASPEDIESVIHRILHHSTSDGAHTTSTTSTSESSTTTPSVRSSAADPASHLHPESVTQEAEGAVKPDGTLLTSVASSATVSAPVVASIPKAASQMNLEDKETPSEPLNPSIPVHSSLLPPPPATSPISATSPLSSPSSNVTSPHFSPTPSSVSSHSPAQSHRTTHQSTATTRTPLVTISTTVKLPHASPSVGSSHSPTPGSESIYRTIMNRLSALESNSSLGVRYIEDQTRSVREALKRLEQDVGRLESLSKHHQTLFKRTMTELQEHRRHVELENLALISRLNHLANEVTLEKRLGLAQLCLLLVVLVFMGFTRSVSTDTSLIEGTLRSTSENILARARRKSGELFRSRSRRSSSESVPSPPFKLGPSSPPSLSTYKPHFANLPPTPPPKSEALPPLPPSSKLLSPFQLALPITPAPSTLTTRHPISESLQRPFAHSQPSLVYREPRSPGAAGPAAPSGPSSTSRRTLAKTAHLHEVGRRKRVNSHSKQASFGSPEGSGGSKTGPSLKIPSRPITDENAREVDIFSGPSSPGGVLGLSNGSPKRHHSHRSRTSSSSNFMRHSRSPSHGSPLSSIARNVANSHHIVASDRQAKGRGRFDDASGSDAWEDTDDADGDGPAPEELDEWDQGDTTVSMRGRDRELKSQVTSRDPSSGPDLAMRENSPYSAQGPDRSIKRPAAPLLKGAGQLIMDSALSEPPLHSYAA